MPNVAYTESLSEWIPNKMHEFDLFPPLGVQTVVNSMSPPHPAEYSSAHHALAQDCATLERIDQDMEECRIRIARAHAQMRLLQQQRHAVQHRVSIHRARISPLRIIPDQVLQEIFQHCLPDTPYIVPRTRSAPLLLTHVCRRWRAVAHGTSELWLSIALVDRCGWNSELDVEMTQAWLDRARMRPLSMSITCPSNARLNRNIDMFHLAIAYSAHLTDLCLNVSKTYLDHFMHHARLPALRSIVIAIHSDSPTDDAALEPTPHTPANALLSASQLTHIAFVGDGSPIYLVPRALFPQLTHLDFDCHLTLDLALLFHDFDHLERLTLTLSLSRSALRFRLPHQRILEPSLRHLEICLDEEMLEFGDKSELDALLDQLEMPALDALVVHVPTGCTRWETWVRSESVFAFLARSRVSPQIEVVCS